MTDDVRIEWECPRCGRGYWVPTTEGLTYCPKCKPSPWHSLRKAKLPSGYAILVFAAAVACFVLGVRSGSGAGLLLCGYLYAVVLTIISFVCGKLRGFEFAFIILTLWFVGLIFMVPDFHDRKVAEFVKMGVPVDEAKDAAAGDVVMNAVFVSAAYIFFLAVLAFAKYFLSRPKTNRD